MLVTLIPLFLAANISVHESNWKYGPEVSYEVEIGSVSKSDTESNDTGTLNWSAKLICREKSRLALSCHIYPLQKFETRNGEWSDSAKGPFELHFGDRGLEKIMCSTSLEPAILDTIRAVADQLNLGADLSTIPRDFFDVTENSTSGECKTGYVLSSSDVDDSGSEESDEDDDTDDYEMVIVPGMQTLKGAVKKIERKRRLNECRKQYRHIFAAMQSASPYFAESPVESLVETQIGKNSTEFVTSKSRMTIMENSFSSLTIKVFLTSNDAHPTLITFTEQVEVKLDEIAAAKGPLPVIQDPTTVSIFPERWIRSNDKK